MPPLSKSFFVTCLSLVSSGSVALSATTIVNSFQHQGNAPQQIQHNIGSAVDTSMPYEICYTFTMTIDQGSTGNYGLRSYNESQSSGTYSMAWKNDINGGQLSFFGGNGSNYQISDPDWNIDSSLSTVNGEAYTLCIQVNTTPGQNPGQYGGTYQAQITRLSDGESHTTPELQWTQQNLGMGQFDEIVFYNSSSGTIVDVENVTVGLQADSIPEPSTALLGFLSLFLIIRRHR